MSISRNIIIFVSLIGLSSCSLFYKRSKFEILYKDFLDERNDNNMFIDHYGAIGDAYIETSGTIFLKINKKTKKYFKDVYYQLTTNNEVILSKKVDPTFFIVKSKTPFHFSLPDGRIFFSLGLIKKYFKNELTFISILSFETLRIHQDLYPRKTVIPKKGLETQEILDILRLKLDIRHKINQWAYLVMKRANYDATGYLNWIQAQNKNFLDFSMLRRDAQALNTEEFLFKNFMLETQKVELLVFNRGHNSSSDFYKMLNYFKKIKL